MYIERGRDPPMEPNAMYRHVCIEPRDIGTNNIFLKYINGKEYKEKRK